MMNPGGNISPKILRGIEQICEYGKFSRTLFPEFIRLGLPARMHRGIWWAHADHVDEFMKRFTFVRNKDVPDETM